MHSTAPTVIIIYIPLWSDGDIFIFESPRYSCLNSTTMYSMMRNNIGLPNNKIRDDR